MRHTDNTARGSGLGWRGALGVGLSCLLLLGACRATVERTDQDVASVIAERQRRSLAYQEPVRISAEQDSFAPAPRSAYAKNPNPRATSVPAGFNNVAASQPGAAAGSQPAPTSFPTTTSAPSTAAASQPVHIFTLTNALGYAQEHRRALQDAEEQLYLAALALTLERHLWTPIFASNLTTVYGNYGQEQHFDQAMRFMADLSATQRLPYGGEFTAKAISTLIRDVKKSLTASEGSSIELGLKVPFLRGAGHVAQEQLIKLERELTYAVRTFERFRRQQLVDVAGAYFDLLRTKQLVIDSQTSLDRFVDDFERARDFERAGQGTLLDAQRAEQQVLFAQNDVETQRERFRSQADQFKLLIGMPVDEPLPLEGLEDIESIERDIADGRYPLLVPPPAAHNETLALAVAAENRLDLLSRKDLIDDARRGVAIAQNALLPDLNWNSTVTWITDPRDYSLSNFAFRNTTWRTEMVLGLPLERFAERNQYRASLIDVRQAQRNYQDALESIRAQVRSAMHQIDLQERLVEIQLRNLAVAERRREFARIQYRDGDIGNRDLFEAEDGWTAARNGLNQAKTARWVALLDFRLATETLRIAEDGTQEPVPE